MSVAEQAVRGDQRAQGGLHADGGEEPLGAHEGRHELGQPRGHVFSQRPCMYVTTLEVQNPH